ncbi:uncharacterized protein [Montipora foliosa]|uniref:uncharacterized protein n=1 Tax=Montipora foliosa TaxID=591990 RepID=UPI0035F10356
MTPYPIREEYGMEFPVLWSGLSSFIHEFVTSFSRISADCVDKSPWCADANSHSRCAFDISFKLECRKTCGICLALHDSPDITIKDENDTPILRENEDIFEDFTGCMDKSPSCADPKAHRWCTGDVKFSLQCPKTCGTCPDPHDSPDITIKDENDTPILRENKDIFEDFTGCMDKSPSCADPKAHRWCTGDVKFSLQCPKTCGTCPDPHDSPDITIKDENDTPILRENEDIFEDFTGCMEKSPLCAHPRASQWCKKDIKFASECRKTCGTCVLKG